MLIAAAAGLAPGVVAGSSGNDIYVARYLLPPRR